MTGRRLGRGAPKAPGGLIVQKIALDCKWKVERRHDGKGNTYFGLRAIGGLGEVGSGLSSNCEWKAVMDSRDSTGIQSVSLMKQIEMGWGERS